MSERAIARPGSGSHTITLDRLVEVYGVPLKYLAAFEETGVIVVAGADRYHCDDDDRLVIAAAAVQLGFDQRELRELMKLYDGASPQRRALPHFMKLLANYQRLMPWRHPETCDDTSDDSVGRHRAFRASIKRFSADPDEDFLGSA